MTRFSGIFLGIVGLLLVGAISGSAAQTTTATPSPSPTAAPLTATAQAQQNATATRISTQFAQSTTRTQRTDLRILQQRTQMTVVDDRLMVVAAFDEVTANVVLDTFVGLADYTAEQSSLELQDGGVLTTISGAWSGQTLQFWTTGTLNASGGGVDLVVEWATLDGQPIGLEPFLLAEFMMEVVVSDELVARLDAIFADLDTLDYRMTRAYVNDNAIVVDAEVIFLTPPATATPQPTSTPAG